MASRFLSSRDIEQFTRFNRELVGDLKRDKDGIINQLVKIFQISASDTKTNLYGEAVGGVKTFSPGVELPCTIQADDFDFNTDEFGPDLRQTVVYGFMRDTLIEADFRPEIGDIIDWNHAHWEINSINENQLIGGKYDENFSVVCNTHLIRKRALNIERIRSI